MNTYCFEDIYIGLTESFEVTVEASMLDAFFSITGDCNPLHRDTEYAKIHGFEDRVCYGLLTSSFLSTLAGVYLPGEKSLIREISIKLPKPVYVGDILSVSGEVTDKNDDFGFFDMKVTVRNQKGEKVLRGKMQIGVLE